LNSWTWNLSLLALGVCACVCDLECVCVGVFLQATSVADAAITVTSSSSATAADVVVGVDGSAVDNTFVGSLLYGEVATTAAATKALNLLAASSSVFSVDATGDVAIAHDTLVSTSATVAGAVTVTTGGASLSSTTSMTLADVVVRAGFTELLCHAWLYWRSSNGVSPWRTA
jgi:hypothetical protein